MAIAGDLFPNWGSSTWTVCDQLWLDKRGTHGVWGFLSAWSTIHTDTDNFNKITSVSDIVVKTDPGRAVQWNP